GFLEDPLAQIDQPPAHDAMDRRDRPAFDPRLESLAVRGVELRGLPGHFPSDEAIRPMGVDLDDPVAHDLQRDAADPGRLRARRAVIDRRQRQKPPRLRTILHLFGDRPKLRRVKINPQRNRHGEPPSFALLNQTRAALGSSVRVTISETWYQRALEAEGSRRRGSQWLRSKEG